MTRFCSRASPLATNMVTVASATLPETPRLGRAGDPVRSPLLGRPARATQQLAAMGRVFGLGISMHPNSAPGHQPGGDDAGGLTIPNLRYGACDTHHPAGDEG